MGPIAMANLHEAGATTAPPSPLRPWHRPCLRTGLEHAQRVASLVVRMRRPAFARLDEWELTNMKWIALSKLPLVALPLVFGAVACGPDKDKDDAGDAVEEAGEEVEEGAEEVGDEIDDATR